MSYTNLILYLARSLEIAYPITQQEYDYFRHNILTDPIDLNGFYSEKDLLDAWFYDYIDRFDVAGFRRFLVNNYMTPRVYRGTFIFF